MVQSGQSHLVESHGPVPPCEPDQVQSSFELPWLGVHCSSLANVQRLSHCGGDGPRTETGGEVSDEVVREVRSPQQQSLHLVVETQLADCHEDLQEGGSWWDNFCQEMSAYRSACGPVGSIEQFPHSFLLGYSDQPVHSVAVTLNNNNNNKSHRATAGFSLTFSVARVEASHRSAS